MPNYAEPFGELGGRLGNAAGGVAGAGGGGFLSTIAPYLQPLDYPRQALWNAIRAPFRASQGDTSWAEALRGALPGLAGGALAGGLMATGVGAPLGILAGSALGAFGQGMGKLSGREAFDAPEVSDLTGTEDFVPNFLVGALTDPLSYAGIGHGAARGAAMGEKIGANFGKGLEEAALARGPRYPGGFEKIDNLYQQALDKGVTDPHKLGELDSHLAHLERAVDENPMLLGEIPPEWRYGRHGVEAVGGPTDAGWFNMSRPSPTIEELGHRVNYSAPPPTRPDIPEMLQAGRTTPFSGEFPVRAEHTPFMDIASMDPPAGAVHGSPEYNAWYSQAKIADDEAKQLRRKLFNEQGVSFWDAHGGNVGYSPADIEKEKLFITDAGAVKPNRFEAGPLPLQADMATPQQPGRFKNWLLDMLGADESVQGELARSIETPRGGNPLPAGDVLSPKVQLLAERLKALEARNSTGAFGTSHLDAVHDAAAELKAAAGGTENAGVVMQKMGQPDQIAKEIVRLAKQGEHFTTVDGLKDQLINLVGGRDKANNLIDRFWVADRNAGMGAGAIDSQLNVATGRPGPVAGPISSLDMATNAAPRVPEQSEINRALMDLADPMSGSLSEPSFHREMGGIPQSLSHEMEMRQHFGTLDRGSGAIPADITGGGQLNRYGPSAEQRITGAELQAPLDAMQQSGMLTPREFDQFKELIKAGYQKEVAYTWVKGRFGGDIGLTGGPAAHVTGEPLGAMTHELASNPGWYDPVAEWEAKYQARQQEFAKGLPPAENPWQWQQHPDEPARMSDSGLLGSTEGVDQSILDELSGGLVGKDSSGSDSLGSLHLEMPTGGPRGNITNQLGDDFSRQVEQLVNRAFPTRRIGSQEMYPILQEASTRMKYYMETGYPQNLAQMMALEDITKGMRGGALNLGASAMPPVNPLSDALSGGMSGGMPPQSGGFLPPTSWKPGGTSGGMSGSGPSWMR